MDAAEGIKYRRLRAAPSPAPDTELRVQRFAAITPCTEIGSKCSPRRDRNESPLTPARTVDLYIGYIV
jgi:hypothetical protein